MQPKSAVQLLICLVLVSLSIHIQTAYCQTITRSPTNGPVGTSVTVTGSAFLPSSPVTISYDGAQVTNGTTSSIGAFTSIFLVPSSTRDAHTIIATDGTNTATTTFTVTSSLSRTPTSGPVGTTITLTGYGFAASTTITIRWDGTQLATSPSSVATDSKGAFTATVIAPPGEPVVHTISSSDASGSATASFTITRNIILLPNSGSTGNLVSVTGSGYLASSTIVITFDGATVATTPATIVSDGLGGFAASFTVPSASPGSHTVKATDNIGGSAQSTFTVTPSISLSPSTGRGGTTVTVTGAGFAPSDTVTIKFDAATILTAPTDSSGWFSQVFTIPLAAAGSHLISATDMAGTTASAIFSVTPSISLAPSSGAVGTIVTVAGAGFAGSATITLLFAGLPMVTTPATILTDVFGGFTASFTVPSASAGAWSVLATDSTGFKGAATFAVTRRLSLSSTSGVAGTVVTVRGTGFAPGAQILFTFDAATLTTSPSPVVTDAKGRFNASFAIPASIQGSHTIVADDLLGGSVSASYTINPSVTLDPPRGNTGNIVTVTGKGFGQTSLVTVSFDGSPVVTTPTPVETDDLGSFSVTFTVDPSAPGSHTVRATDLFGNTATATFTVTRQISLSSSSGGALSAVTVTGAGFEPASGVTLTWDGSLLNALPSPIVTDAVGGFRAVFTVPLDVAGQHVLVATDGVGNTASSAYTLSASISATPSGLSVGDELWIRGTGFSAASRVVITWDGISVLTRPSDVATGLDGSFSTSFMIPPCSFGAHRILAVDERGNSSSSSYTISAVSALDVRTDVGAIYFKGEVTEFYALTTQSGRPFNASMLAAKLFLPGGAVEDLSGVVVRVDTGTYRIDYVVPGDAAPGTYALVVNASRVFDGVPSYGASLRAFEVSQTFGEMNATLTAINGTLGSLSLDTGPILVRLDELEASMSSLISTSKGEILAKISTTAGTITSRLDTLDASLTSIKGEMANVSTSLGSVLADVGTINAKIDALNGSMAKVESAVGSINVSVSDLNPKLASIHRDALTLQTDLGSVEATLDELKARSIDIEGGIVRIETEVGTIRATLEEITGVTVAVNTPAGAKGVTLFTDMDLMSVECQQAEHAICLDCTREAQSTGRLSVVVPKELLGLLESSCSKLELLSGGEKKAFSLKELADVFILQTILEEGRHQVILYLCGPPSILLNAWLWTGILVLLLGLSGVLLIRRKRRVKARPDTPKASGGTI